ncbi:PadR family transcriptional regulator [Pilimelia anulata]|uniref:PadR family transcriptional regulator n=1 Tax=Pilimelia anulata TaxID=53371 RepID=A0A8J3BBP8_9ACTN|nr:PadR family transcriptional regulator [Pilimelia anulata]GGJ94979.1 PadR family transcriptional regulator [Pilimelia anulata]
MSTPHVLLGLLATGPAHGYDLKRAYDARLPRTRPLAYGQVYATLGRLTRDGLVRAAGTGRGAGPERTTYAVTDAGRAALAAWLDDVEPPAPYAAGALLARVVVALLTTDPARARAHLGRQRAAHSARLRELTARRGDPATGPGERMAVDHAILHLDADLRWIQHTTAHLADLAAEMNPERVGGEG